MLYLPHNLELGSYWYDYLSQSRFAACNLHSIEDRYFSNNRRSKAIISQENPYRMILEIHRCQRKTEKWFDA